MTGTITTRTVITGVTFSQAWRADDGTPQATVRLGGATLSATLLFDNPAIARAVAAACVQAAGALEALPEDTPGGGAS